MNTQTPFDTLTCIRENLHLDVTQFQSIEAAIVSQHETLSRIDARKTILERELYDLDLQREAVVKEESFTRALLAPVRRIPSEVLGEIFTRCANLDDQGELFIDPWESRSPTLLTHISHRWREVAHGTPELWTNIKFRRIPSGQQEFIQLWLQNSGSLPLDISMYFSHYDHHLTPEELVVVGSVIQNRYRIRSLYVNAFRATIKTIIGAGQSGDFPLLQELWLDDPQYLYPIPEPSDMVEIDAGIHTPQLHTLRLYRVPFVMDALKSLSNLQKFYITDTFTGQSLYNFLLQCSVIEKITSSVFMMEPPFPTTPEPIVLCRLWKLDVRWMPPHQDPMHCFLKWIRTPMLQTLKVQGYPDESQPTLWKFIRNVRSSLLHIGIEDTNLSSDPFTGSMQALIEISSIRISNCPTSVGFWEMLTPEGNTAPLRWNMPKLESFRCSFADPIPEEIEAAFVRFVERRAPPVAIPREVTAGESVGHYLSEVNLARSILSDTARKTLMRLKDARENFTIWDW